MTLPEEVQKDYRDGIKRLNDLLKVMIPDITDLNITMIDNEVKSIVRQTILNIGNHTNGLTQQITHED